MDSNEAPPISPPSPQPIPSIFGGGVPTPQIIPVTPDTSLPDVQYPASEPSSPQQAMDNSHDSATSNMNAPISPTSHTSQTPQVLLIPAVSQPNSQLSVSSHPQVRSGPITPMVPPPPTPSKAPEPLDMRKLTGFHLPAPSPAPASASAPMDMRTRSGLHLPASSPAPSQIVSSNSSHTPEGNKRAFEKSQALFQRAQAAQRAREDQAASGSSKSVTQKGPRESCVEEDDSHIANSMQVDEDNSWMDEEPDGDDEVLRVAAKFNSLNSKKKNGKLTLEDTMDLNKYGLRLLALNKVRTRDKAAKKVVEVVEEEEDDDPTSMFIPDKNKVSRHEQSDNDDDDDDEQPSGSSYIYPARQGADEDNSNEYLSQMLQEEASGDGIDGPGSLANADKGFKKNGEPRVRRAKAKTTYAKTAREVFNARDQKKAEKEREKERKKALKQNGKVSAATTKSKGKGKEIAKDVGKGKKSGKKAKIGKVVKNGESLLRPANTFKKGEDEFAERILLDLLVDDPFSARLTNPIYQVEGEKEVHGKEWMSTAFQRLYSNIPENVPKATIKNDKKILREASQAFGHKKISVVDGMWLLKGMNTPLYHHQLLGAKWMLEREFSHENPKGGLLCDSMGMGKTIQSIACMVANPPTKADIARGVKATLIVCPAAIIDQWIKEIEYHAGQSFKKVVHYKSSAQLSLGVLQDMDVVVTSYTEIMRQFPYPDAKAREEILQLGSKASWWKNIKELLGPLHQINWYRVILDEAHNIKNNAARTSIAAQNIRSIYRWCLSGTPLLNNLEELFPYLRFCQVPQCGTYKTFQRYFCDPNSPDCYARIATILSYAMIRRTLNTSLLGRPIITLPEPSPVTHTLDFSPMEKIIYRITESAFRRTLNKFFQQGDAQRNYSTFLVQLLRLRQCTSHPFMLEQTIRESWTLEDVHELKRRLSRLNSAEMPPFYEQVKVWVADKVEGDQVVLPFGKSDFGHSFSFDKALETLDEKEMLARLTCGLCADFPVSPHRTSCNHIFCEECITTSIHKDLARDEVTVCPVCDKTFGGIERVEANNSSAPDLDGMDSRSSDNGRKAKKRRIVEDSKGIDMMGHEPRTNSTWVPMSDYTPGFPLTASAKTAALKAILLNGFDEAPMDKWVIYVQFRTLARIVGRICKSENYGFLYLTGDTSQEHRVKVVAKFESDPDAKILIAGLKCGGVGLNFPFANRVISLDLWWNHAVEQQAFGRVFRLGQKKCSFFHRCVIRNSVDQRLLNMQLHKMSNIEKAIKDGDNQPKPNLSLHQLSNLFGFLRTDEDDNILSIEADYDDAEEWEAAGRATSPGSDD